MGCLNSKPGAGSVSPMPTNGFSKKIDQSAAASKPTSPTSSSAATGAAAATIKTTTTADSSVATESGPAFLRSNKTPIDPSADSKSSSASGQKSAIGNQLQVTTAATAKSTSSATANASNIDIGSIPTVHLDSPSAAVPHGHHQISPSSDNGGSNSHKKDSAAPIGVEARNQGSLGENIPERSLARKREKSYSITTLHSIADKSIEMEGHHDRRESVVGSMMNLRTPRADKGPNPFQLPMLDKKPSTKSNNNNNNNNNNNDGNSDNDKHGHNSDENHAANAVTSPSTAASTHAERKKESPPSDANGAVNSSSSSSVAAAGEKIAAEPEASASAATATASAAANASASGKKSLSRAESSAMIDRQLALIAARAMAKPVGYRGANFSVSSLSSQSSIAERSGPAFRKGPRGRLNSSASQTNATSSATISKESALQVVIQANEDSQQQEPEEASEAAELERQGHQNPPAQAKIQTHPQLQQLARMHQQVPASPLLVAIEGFGSRPTLDKLVDAEMHVSAATPAVAISNAHPNQTPETASLNVGGNSSLIVASNNNATHNKRPISAMAKKKVASNSSISANGEVGVNIGRILSVTNSVPTVLVIGPPGSGKSILCAIYAQEFGLVHVSFKECLMKEAAFYRGSEEEQMIERMGMGEEDIPLDIGMELMARELESVTSAKEGILLEGFPAEVTHLPFLKALDIWAVVQTTATNQVLEDRLLVRSGHNVNKDRMPWMKNSIGNSSSNESWGSSLRNNPSSSSISSGSGGAPAVIKNKLAARVMMSENAKSFTESAESLVLGSVAKEEAVSRVRDLLQRATQKVGGITRELSTRAHITLINTDISVDDSYQDFKQAVQSAIKSRIEGLAQAETDPADPVETVEMHSSTIHSASKNADQIHA